MIHIIDVSYIATVKSVEREYLTVISGIETIVTLYRILIDVCLICIFCSTMRLSVIYIVESLHSQVWGYTEVFPSMTFRLLTNI